MTYEAKHPFQFAHMVFFQLADRTPVMMRAFVDACQNYLHQPNLQIYFSVGLRDVEIQRDVSATDFDVSMHIIFADRADYDEYAASKEHDEFITATAGMSTARRVFDSYLAPPAASKNNAKS